MFLWQSICLTLTRTNQLDRIIRKAWWHVNCTSRIHFSVTQSASSALASPPTTLAILVTLATVPPLHISCLSSSLGALQLLSTLLCQHLWKSSDLKLLLGSSLLCLISDSRAEVHHLIRLLINPLASNGWSPHSLVTIQQPCKPFNRLRVSSCLPPLTTWLVLEDTGGGETEQPSSPAASPGWCHLCGRRDDKQC